MNFKPVQVKNAFEEFKKFDALREYEECDGYQVSYFLRMAQQEFTNKVWQSMDNKMKLRGLCVYHDNDLIQLILQTVFNLTHDMSQTSKSVEDHINSN